MRKNVLSLIAFLVCVFTLSGCMNPLSLFLCQHEWQAATCTEPKTCIKCGEIKGEALGHQWKQATMTEPEKCMICGIEAPFSHSISTQKVMGTWTAENYLANDEVISGNLLKSEIRFVEDGTGYLKVGDKENSIQWSFNKEKSDMIEYRITLLGEDAYAGYVTDTSNILYGQVILALDDETAIVFKKVS